MVTSAGKNRRLSEIVNIFEKETTGKKQETIQIGRQHAMKREDNNRSNTTFMRRQHVRMLELVTTIQ